MRVNSKGTYFQKKVFDLGDHMVWFKLRFLWAKKVSKVALGFLFKQEIGVFRFILFEKL